jgi:molybdate transport system permease protein
MTAGLLPLADGTVTLFVEALALSLRLSLATALLLIVLGVPLAHWLNTSRLPGIAVIETLVALPVVLPPTVIGFYLLVAFAPGHWPGNLWQRVTGHSLPFSFAGLLVGSVLYSLPYAVQPFQAGLRGVPAVLLEAAAATGARPWRVFWRVRLPLARRGLLVGAALAFAHTMGEFGVVLMLGGGIPGQTRVASIALYDEVEKGSYPTAHLYAVTLLLISGALLSVVTWLQRRAPLD